VQVHDLALLHAQTYASSTAEGYIAGLRAAGLQPGTLLSGGARDRLLALLPGKPFLSAAATVAAAAKISVEEPAMCVMSMQNYPVLACCCPAGACSQRAQAAFKAFDSCTLPLISLVELLMQSSSPAAFAHALLKTLPAWVDAVRVFVRQQMRPNLLLLGTWHLHQAAQPAALAYVCMQYR
jgi:hypothetical protein